jgi:hypothetical protein
MCKADPDRCRVRLVSCRRFGGECTRPTHPVRSVTVIVCGMLSGLSPPCSPVSTRSQVHVAVGSLKVCRRSCAVALIERGRPKPHRSIQLHALSQATICGHTRA